MAETTLTGLLDRHGREQPQHSALAHIGDLRTGEVAARLDYAGLVTRARSLAGRLLADGHRPKDRALLLFDTGLEFVVAFFGCAYAGITAVPVPPPGRSRVETDRLRGVVRDADATVALTSTALYDEITDGLAGTSIVCHPVDLTVDHFMPDSLPPVTGGDLALLQYTSGSTSEPKGVMVTHHNLLDNLARIHDRLGNDVVPRVCGWLPLTHDMGLIGQLLIPLYLGGECILVSPTAFLKSPLRWLAAQQEWNCDIAVAPNFALELCVRRVTTEQAATIDLSRLTRVFTGAEPIRAQTLAGFAERLAPAGFRADSLLPCYGLAESTLMVAAKDHPGPVVTTAVDQNALAKGRFEPSPQNGQVMVASGAFPDSGVRIADPQTGCALPDGEVGEIWVTGASVAAGYWRNPTATAETFGARAPEDDRDWLRTGDLGARHEGQLYITGRRKDVIIIGARNLYPQDLEAVAQSEPGLALVPTVVFGLDDEHIVVVQETGSRRGSREGLTEAAATIRRNLVRDFGIGAPSVVYVKTGRVRRTTSGKVQRALMRRLFVTDGLEPVYQSLTPGVDRYVKEQ